MRPTVRVQLGPCSRCRAATCRAWTQPPAAWEAVTDPIPLDPMQELRVLAEKRMTYDLVTLIISIQLVHRDQFRIRNRDWPVFAEHKCPGPVPWAAIPPPPEVKERCDDDDDPPY